MTTKCPSCESARVTIVMVTHIILPNPLEVYNGKDVALTERLNSKPKAIFCYSCNELNLIKRK